MLSIALLSSYSHVHVASLIALQAWCDKTGLDTVMHPVTKCMIFLEDLLTDMVAKKSKDPFGTIRVARKALSKIRSVLAVSPLTQLMMNMVLVFTESCKEGFLHHMEKHSAKKHSSNQPAARHLQLPQKPG